MSTHPNAMILAVLTPDGLTRKTYRAILDEAGIDAEGSLKIGEREDYSVTVMEDSYDDSWQISAPEGSIVVHAYLTYGYGENIAWADTVKMHDELAAWATGICERHVCAVEIFISANYW